MKTPATAAEPAGPSVLQVIREFCRALADGHTYAPRKNPEVLFGFLWGAPIPVFALGIHLYAASLSWNLACCGAVIQQHPVHIFFLLHPVLFAVVFGALGTMREVRERRIRTLVEDVRKRCGELSGANERLKELDRLKSEFLANVTHELKSPLVTALGYTDRVLGRHLGEINARQEKGLEVSKRNLNRLRKLIDEVLDFSRLEAGCARLKKAPTNLLEVVKAAMDSLALRARVHDLTFDLHLPAEPAWVLGDSDKLVQVAINLLDNAIKFSPEAGCLRVTVETNHGRWRLIVSDQGPGIPPQELPKLFERFYQVDGSSSRPHSGVGLGLVIVRKIVEAHDGKVWLESRPGAGTKAIMELPALVAPGNRSTPAQEVAHPESAASASERRTR